MNDFLFPIFSQATGARVWREAVNDGPNWEPDDDDLRIGARVNFDDGIYIVTVNEDTPDDWIHLARRATIAAEGQHPGPDFLPADNYDSGIAVRSGRIVGAVTANPESRNFYRWNVRLRPDGDAYTRDEVACPGCAPDADHPGRARFDPELRQRNNTPAIFSIWVHRSRRGQRTGGQLVRAIAGHFGLSHEEIGYRLPLSQEAVRMVIALGLNEIIGCF